MPVLQPARYDELLARRASEAVRLRMDPAFIRTLLRAVHGESVRQQLERTAPDPPRHPSGKGATAAHGADRLQSNHAGRYPTSSLA